jgi:hypothetical protein
MDFQKSKNTRLSERDLRFLIGTAAPGVSDKANLARIIREDEDFRNSFICDEKIFRRLMDDEEALVKISINEVERKGDRL